MTERGMDIEDYLRINIKLLRRERSLAAILICGTCIA